MKTHILSVGLTLAVLILGPSAESRLLAQEPKNRVGLENVNYTGGNNTPGGTYGADSVAFSPDGKTLAAAYTDRDGHIRLWDVASGKNTATFKVGHATSCSVAFSPDGKTLASGGAEIILWDVASAKKTATLGKGGSYLAFSPDGKTLASGGAEIILWDVASGKKTAALGKGARSLAFSPDGKILASSPFVELALPDRINPPNDPTPIIELWDVASGKSIAILKDEAAVWCVAFSADSKTLAAGGAETVRLWNVATGKKTATLKAATENMSWDCVRSVAFSADGKTVAAGSMCVIKFWNVATGERTANFTAHTHWVTSVAFTRDGKTFASSSYLGDNAPLVKLWDLSPSGPAQAQVPADLLKAQFATAGKVFHLNLQLYKAGALKSDDLECLYLWSVRLLNAERDLSNKPADRVAAAEAHLERMKTVEEMAKVLVKMKQAGARQEVAAEFYRVEAQIWLSQAKGK